MLLNKVLADSKSIIKAYSPHISQTLDDILFRDLLKYVGLVFKLSKEELKVAANSVRLFKGQTLTKDNLRCIALRLAANKNFLKELVEIPYWDGSRTDAVVLCKGITYNKEVKAKSRVLVLHCVVIGGIAAGLEVTCQKPANLINYWQYKYLKFGRGAYEAEEIAKTIFRCSIEEVTDGVDIKDPSVTPVMKEMNKKVFEKRYDPQKCKTPNKLCWACKKTVTECTNACRYEGEE